MGIRADNQGMKINDGNGPNATDCSAEVLQYQPRNRVREAKRPGVNTIYAEWQRRSGDASCQKTRVFLKCPACDSGNRGIRQIMKVTDTYLSETRHREMAAGVLKQAKHDLRRFRGARSKIGRELYLDAYRWLNANECSWPFSFLNVCQVLDLAPVSVRQELINESSLGPLGYWTRRCGRAARRFRGSLSGLFVSEPKNEPENTTFAEVSGSTIAI
jgi:hypothetical protein